MTQFEVLAHIGTAKVEIAILHTQVVATVALFLDGERRCDALVQDVQLAHDYLYVTSRQVLVLRLALANLTDNLNHPFASKLVGTFAQGCIGLLVKHQLSDAITVAQVNKRHSSHLTSALNPSAQGYALSNIGKTKLATGLCSIHFIIITNYELRNTSYEIRGAKIEIYFSISKSSLGCLINVVAPASSSSCLSRKPQSTLIHGSPQFLAV